MAIEFENRIRDERRKMRGDTVTRSPTQKEIDAMPDGPDKRSLQNFLDKMKEQENKQEKARGGMVKTKKMKGVGMASKRNGNMDYRKGGMVLNTKVKRG